MTGTIELDRDGQHLLISFPYREDLVEQVRTLPGRRWDRGSRTWRVPAEHAEVVVATFLSHGFQIAPEVSSVLAGTTPQAAPKPKTKRQPKPATPADPAAALTVSLLNERVRDVLATGFPGRVQVVGEVIDFDKNQERKHVFFSLVEKATGGEKVKATVQVALFERTASRLVPALAANGLVLRDGIEILIDARVDFYPPSGRFQLIIEDIRPEFTLGKLALSREQILDELREKGLLAVNRDKPMSVPCLRIGVLSSPDSDGWNDFLQELTRSGIGFDVGLYPIRVQGTELEQTALAGLRWFADRAADWDVLCIVRGGGSRTDLAWFDNRAVALAVAKHPLKIVCGIGHERDRSVLDEIAHGEKTPTAAAGLLVEQHRVVQRALLDRTRLLAELARDRTARERAALVRAGGLLGRLLHARLAGERQRLWLAPARVVRALGARLVSGRRDLEAAQRRLRSAAAGRLQHERDGLAHRATRHRLLDPRAVLHRGFALVRDAGGKVVSDATALRRGTGIRIALRDGEAAATVESISLDRPSG